MGRLAFAFDPAWRRRAALTAALAAMAGSPPAAGAQSNAFQGGPAPVAPSAPTQTTTVAPSTTTASGTSSSGPSTGTEIAIGIVGALLLLGIGWAIFRDARARAPVPQAAGPGESPEARRRRAQRRRAQAKTARAQRRRNR